MIHFRIDIEFGLDPDNNFLIRIKDHGVGIEDGERELIFEKKYRGKKSEEREGEGLGLWVVRNTLESYGGKIYVSNLRLPTEFTIMLPKNIASKK